MAHRKRRRRRRSKLGRFVLQSLLTMGMFVAILFGATIFFKVETIVVEGNTHYSAEEIISATNIQLGSNLFTVERGQISEKITYSLPYIQNISIKLQLPTSICLVVEEQVGIVELVTSDAIWYMGIQGKLLEKVNKPLAPMTLPEEVISTETEEADYTISNLSSLGSSVETMVQNFNAEEAVHSLLNWGATDEEWTLDLDPDDPIITVTGLSLVTPHPGQMVEVLPEDSKQLDALLLLFEILEERDMFYDVSYINIHEFQYFEFYYQNRFFVKLPFYGDYDYKLRALEAAVSQTERYETGIMDLTQEQYAVLFVPD